MGEMINAILVRKIKRIDHFRDTCLNGRMKLRKNINESVDCVNMGWGFRNTLINVGSHIGGYEEFYHLGYNAV
jgi:hypothetical protein